MVQTMTQATEISCRRCGREYSLRRRMLLPACPHCGKAPVPLTRRLRHNGLAAVMCVLALVTLAIAINRPFISMSKLSEERTFSLLSGIFELFRTNQVLIGSILLIFSVIFPFAKLLAILTATSSLVPLSARSRNRLHWLASVTGKYSLLDILVVAIVIVLVKFKGLAEAHAQAGTMLFCAAIFLSILAGFAVDLDEPGET
jgi:paraquat-inducible protein A